jgi:SEL1 protein
MGLRFSMGLDQPDCWSEDAILRFGPPNVAQSLLHYYFGAVGGDSASRMALGYRHVQGLGVPKACWSAAAYYRPVGEEVRAVTGAALEAQARTAEGHSETLCSSERH